MEIRPATAADLPALADGLARLPLLVRYGRDAGRLRDGLGAALERGDGLLLAVERGRPAGLAWFLRQGTLGMGGYLKLMAVLPGAQARGTGTALLRAFEAEVAATSAHGFLLCSDFNAGARRFYERHGWRRVGALPGLVLADVAEVIYWKRLRSSRSRSGSKSPRLTPSAPAQPARAPSPRRPATSPRSAAPRRRSR
jgi:GNAT superfamily N-acetyltransferase